MRVVPDARSMLSWQ